MRGDFSRIRFNPAKHYSAVLEQQGRVALDADGNERTAIDAHLRDTTNIDVIGQYGGPIGDAGFAIRVLNNEILIGHGRYYVEGLLVENETVAHFDEQPYLINPTYTVQELLEAVLEGKGQISAQLSLEVWQRLVTQLDDGCLREPALCQADTTARLQTVWRVVGSLNDARKKNSATGSKTGGMIAHPVSYLPIISESSSSYVDPVTQLSSCCQGLYAQKPASRTGAMGADTGQGNNDCGCQPIPSAGYQGLENQLYRVEIHTPGTLATATFKWSRENASIVTKITNFSGSVVTVISLGPDANLGFQAGQWVELTDDTYLFGDPPNQPGELYQIQSIGPGPLQVTLATPVTGIDTTRNARMRRWDQNGAAASAQGVSLSTNAIPLENGIEVTFQAGAYQAGDYWTIPARTADGEIDWPPCGGDGHFFQPAQFTRIYSAPLACISRRTKHFNRNDYSLAVSGRFEVDDCRLLFPPLTALAQDQKPAALHVKSVSWSNDDIITVDTLLENGLSVTFDQATTCPWGGGNFQVTIEPPFGIGDWIAVFEGKLGIPKPTLNSPPGTDAFVRTVLALDPPWGVTVSGTQVSWITPVSASPAGIVNYGAYAVLGALNTLLNWQNSNPIGYARMRVRLIGGAIYAAGANSNIYLDGLGQGETGTRSIDGSECVNYNFPSGDSLAASDFEGWFYLAPTVVISSVVIQGVENGKETTISALKVLVNSNNQVTGYQIGESATVTNLQALITLSYPPVAATPVSLTLSGTGAGSIVTIAPSVTIPAGQQTYTTPINIPFNPGGGVKDVITLIASVSSAVGPLPFNPAPTLTVTGATPPEKPPA